MMGESQEKVSLKPKISKNRDTSPKFVSQSYFTVNVGYD
jgi:hypothetical protein